MCSIIPTVSYCYIFNKSNLLFYISALLPSKNVDTQKFSEDPDSTNNLDAVAGSPLWYVTSCIPNH